MAAPARGGGRSSAEVKKLVDDLDAKIVSLAERHLRLDRGLIDRLRAVGLGYGDEHRRPYRRSKIEALDPAIAATLQADFEALLDRLTCAAADSPTRSTAPITVNRQAEGARSRKSSPISAGVRQQIHRFFRVRPQPDVDTLVNSQASSRTGEDVNRQRGVQAHAQRAGSRPARRRVPARRGRGRDGI
jgi:hypothetical protein